MEAGQAKVVDRCGSTVLAGDDVIDMKSDLVGLLGRAVILATPLARCQTDRVFAASNPTSVVVQFEFDVEGAASP